MASKFLFSSFLVLIGNLILTIHAAEAPDFTKELTVDNFKSTLEQHTNTIVMFFAPWCGHCQETKPKFRKAAEELVKLDKTKLFALLNCDDTKNSNFCTKENIEGYPTFKVYQKSTLIGEYDDEPAEKEFVEYMKNPPKPGEKRPSKRSHQHNDDAAPDTPMKNVLYIDGEKIEDFLKQNNHVLVFFYAPWCPHCVDAKPKFEEGATTMIIKEKISDKIFMAINCDESKNKNFCNKEKVEGFPTIRYYHKGEMFAEYEEEFEGKSFVTFMKNPPKEKVPPTPIEEEISESKEENATKSDKGKKEQDTPMKGVEYLTSKTFYTLLENTQGHTLIIFYKITNCFQCTEAKFNFEQAAADVKYNKEFKFAAVDCEAVNNKDLCLNQKIGHDLVINYYHKGIKEEIYPGPTPTTKSLISYISKKSTQTKTEL